MTSKSLKKQFFQKLTGFLLSLMLRLFYLSYRYKIKGLENLNNYQRPFIMVFWHGHQLLMPKFYNTELRHGQKVYALISDHSDGRIAAYAVSYLGINSIAGSSTRGGARALVALKKTLEQGHNVAITPDGPKGPVYVAKKGALKLASLTGINIMPVCLSASSYWQFNSWDKMILPKPFSKVYFELKEAFFVEKNISEEDLEGEIVRLGKVLASPL